MLFIYVYMYKQHNYVLFNHWKEMNNMKFSVVCIIVWR